MPVWCAEMLAAAFAVTSPARLSAPLVADDAIHAVSPSNVTSLASVPRRSACIAGREVATFYMLGMQKCATSSVAQVLLTAGLTLAGPDTVGYTWGSGPIEDYGGVSKEMHTLDEFCGGNDANIGTGNSCVGSSGTSAVTRKAFVKDAFFPCGDLEHGWNNYEEESTSVPANSTLADFTPDYGRFFGLARFMSELYGGSSQSLMFVFMLREPASRVASGFAFQQFNEKGFANLSSYVTYLRTALPPTYAATAANLSALDASNDLLDPFVRSLYGCLLQPWLNGPSAFSVPQFAFLPMVWATGNMREAVSLLSSHFSLQLDMTDVPEVAPKSNEEGAAAAAAGKDPDDIFSASIDELSPSELAWLNGTFFEPDSDLLATLLAQGVCHGSTIGGLPAGQCAEASAVKAHLRSWW